MSTMGMPPCERFSISRWKGRFEAERLACLYSHYRGRAVAKRTPALEARIHFTC